MRKFLGTILLLFSIAVSLGLGKYVADATESALPFLSIGGSFGFTPVTFNFADNSFTIGISLSMNLLQFILLVICIFIYPKIMEKIPKE